MLALLGLWLARIGPAAAAPKWVVESPREIPVARVVDVAVVGGSSGAVACACEAARRGAKVFLLAPRPYLGTDLCATLRLWLEDGEEPKSEPAAACFGGRRLATPYAVKAAMDRAMLEAGAGYLTGCFATDLLRDRAGRIAGVVMANRSGRQAVVAKVVVDASERAVVARLAGAEFRPAAAGPEVFRRVVAGGPLRKAEGVSGRTLPFTFDSAKGRRRLAVHEYTLRVDVGAGGLRAFLRAENRARDLTCTPGGELASERLFHLPADTIVGEARLETWPGAEKAPLGAFRPKATDRLFVLGAYSDLGVEAASKMRRPLALMATGRRIGRAAAAQAATLAPPRGAGIPARPVVGGMRATVGEDLGGIRPSKLGTVRAGTGGLPILGRFDVVVVGGGTSGAPAGIGAAAGGARTLVIEYLHELGGVGTAGLIGRYWRGLRRGFTARMDRQVNPGGPSWNVAAKAEWYRRELTRRGAEVWFGTLGCGAITQGRRVRGVVVVTPWGRGAVLAEVVIDATGNADVAAAAGAPTQYGITETGSLNVQLAGFPDRPIGRSYVNTCYTMVDDTDVLDVWHLMKWKRTSAGGQPPAFDVGQLVDSRERRRIVGDCMLRTHDILNRRTFPDTISQHYSNFDAAAFPDAPLLLLADAKGPDYRADLPYRALLPKGLDGILVVGLGSSADRDAMTLIRMQADLQNQGYAAGLAAAAAAKRGGRTRQIDIKAVQKRLVAEGVLDERVLTDRDSCPMSAEAVEKAAAAVIEAPTDRDLLRPLAVLLAHPGQAVGLLKARYRAARGTARLRCAQVLAVLGDPTGAAALAEAVDACDRWDAGVPLTSQRKTGNTFTRLDRLVIALGCTRAPAAMPALLAKLRQLEPDSALSHYKAISLALRHLPPADAAVGPLAALLRRPGFTGHATVDPNAPRLTVSGKRGGSLNAAYRELIVAAMLYRCGDRDGAAGRILRQYARDIHGHFARYARHVLAGGAEAPARDPGPIPTPTP